ncbi:hypothetical protein V8B55DRAFT_1564218 [Mucor lusitanicus]|uniref:Uncharacterized protein n=2 Tax=Mucor circinelloides f. lusitanicus TaxID=29924 RepID=A0A168PS63_MUCCL|nr:hypothetical protein FB192DRAFT_1341619 [Mucor lusitanicus]OAD08138.1 hypothetical protein MUCCIDRAFT_76941 [Mucor lusitanicus CBS 277.49]
MLDFQNPHGIVVISVKPHFLRRTDVLEALVGIVDTSTPGFKLMGTTGEEFTEDGKRKFLVTLDLLPVQSFALDATCIRMETFARPLVFEEYEAGKGAVDTANNRRDNMPSFHDVMKTYRWEIRCLSFFFAVAEANALSAYKYVEIEDRMNHFEFRWRLAESLLDHARVMSEGLGEREPYQLRQANCTVSGTLKIFRTRRHKHPFPEAKTWLIFVELFYANDKTLKETCLHSLGPTIICV